MGQPANKNIRFLTWAGVSVGIAGLVFTVTQFGFFNKSEQKLLKKTLSAVSQNTSIPDSAHDSMISHRITIKNVQNNEQLGEILRIVEKYTKENKVKNLKIECFRDSLEDTTLLDE